MYYHTKWMAVIAICCSIQLPHSAFSQQALSLKDALRIGVAHYGTIRAKQKYAAASLATVRQTKLDYLPNFNLGAQLDYGTANGANGPAYAFGSIGIASTGLPLTSQNWNSAFGSMLLANINWDFFAFGRSRERIKTAGLKNDLDNSDLQQEIFQHQVRIAAAYLNLLAAQRLTASYRTNLQRADTLRAIIRRKAEKELLPGVDSSQANAEVSNAKSILLKAMTYEDQQNSVLIKMLGTDPQMVQADTLFVVSLPASLAPASDTLLTHHPILEYFNSRIRLSEQQVNYYKTLGLPTFSLGAALQGRGTGFGSSYTAANPNYKSSLADGIGPDRANYVIGFGITWNLTQPLRIREQVRSQRLISEGLKEDLELTRQQLATQLNLSDSTIRNAVADYYETPQQVKAADNVYEQKLVLYNHGLTNLVDVTQALYALVRAETDRDISYSNVWQALLLKAAAVGDFNLFYNNL
ncbi:TolC family protein [Puia sp.]|jgi:outer membrane protein TolC|uniref:TolC family protein n=1 Tax=Puia sp. TaxID=2045100 RepID=UPI002F3F3F9E